MSDSDASSDSSGGAAYPMNRAASNSGQFTPHTVVGGGGGSGGGTAGGKEPPIDVARSRYPYCVVWTPLPLITWFLPFIGHMGICDSEGIIYDFAGPYYVSRDDMAFGKPTRYLRLDPTKVTRGTWDQGVQRGCEVYCKRVHNLICDNCHSHVARCLNEMGYNRSSAYNMVWLAAMITFQGRWVSFGRFLQSWLPFFILVAIIVLIRFVA